MAQTLLVLPLVIQKDHASLTSFIPDFSCKLESLRHLLKILMPQLHLTKLSKTPQRIPGGLRTTAGAHLPPAPLFQTHRYVHLALVRPAALLTSYLCGVSSVSGLPLYSSDFDKLFDLQPKHMPSYHVEMVQMF